MVPKITPGSEPLGPFAALLFPAVKFAIRIRKWNGLATLRQNKPA